MEGWGRAQAQAQAQEGPVCWAGRVQDSLTSAWQLGKPSALAQEREVSQSPCPHFSPRPQPLITTILPTAGPTRQPCTIRIWWGLGGSFPRNGPVSHQPAQEVAPPVQPRQLTTGPQFGPQSERPFMHDLRTDRATVDSALTGCPEWWARRQVSSQLHDPALNCGNAQHSARRGPRWAWGETKKEELPRRDCVREPWGHCCSHSSVGGARLRGLGAMAPRARSPHALSRQELFPRKPRWGPGGGTVAPQPTQPAPTATLDMRAQGTIEGKRWPKATQQSGGRIHKSKSYSMSFQTPLPPACWKLPGSRRQTRVPSGAASRKTWVLGTHPGLE